MPRSNTSSFLTSALALTFSLVVMLTLVTSTAAAQYKLTNLVSNQVGKALHTDPLLVNGWGLAYGPGGPFWISDEGSGWSTLYTAAGVKEGLEVLVPTAGGDGPGSPTGIVFNGSQDFPVQGWPSIFMFATLDGTISAGRRSRIPISRSLRSQLRARSIPDWRSPAIHPVIFCSPPTPPTTKLTYITALSIW